MINSLSKKPYHIREWFIRSAIAVFFIVPCYGYGHGLLFNVDPTILPKGSLKASSNFFAVNNHDYFSTQSIIPNFRYGLTHSLESIFAIVGTQYTSITYALLDYALLEQQQNLSTGFDYLEPLLNIEHIESKEGISDYVGLLKWQAYRNYGDRSTTEISWFAGCMFPGNMPQSPVKIHEFENKKYITTPLGYDSGLTSIVLGSSVLFERGEWQLAGSVSLNFERMNKFGNRAGHLLNCSIALGKTNITLDNQLVYTSLECDWIHETELKFQFAKASNSDNDLVWVGPTIMVDYAHLQLKGGIQWPIVIRNAPYFSHRIGLAAELNF